MEKKVKLGMGALWCVSVIFVLVGLSFLALGAGLLFTPRNEEAQIVALTFIPLGAAFLICGGCGFLARHVKGRRAAKMVSSGRYLWAEIVEFRPNYNVRFNGRNPYMVVVCNTDGQGRRHMFKSESSLKLCPDPGLYGKKVKVYYEDESFRHYYVDTEGLIGDVIEH